MDEWIPGLACGSPGMTTVGRSPPSLRAGAHDPITTEFVIASRRMRESTRLPAHASYFFSMGQQHTRTQTLDMLRERRERLATELASLEPVPPAQGGLSARELVIWRNRLAELDSRIERYSEAR